MSRSTRRRAPQSARARTGPPAADRTQSGPPAPDGTQSGAPATDRTRAFSQPPTRPRPATRPGTGTRRGTAPKPPSRTRGFMPLLVGAGAVLAVMAVAILATGSPGSAPASPASPAASASALPTGTGADAAAPLPPYSAEVPDSAVGKPAPAVSGADFAGKPVSIAADGRPKLIVFLAHWCPHCQREVPIVQDWLDAKGVPDGVDIVSVATAIDPARPNYPPDAWLAREGWSVPVIVDESGAIAMQYGLTAFPFWVYVDGQGNVVRRLTDVLEPAELDEAVQQVRGG